MRGLNQREKMYPNISDPEFYSKLSYVAEFRVLDNSDSLYENQELIRRFLGPHTPYQGLFLFHKLGSGKSISCISVAIDHFLYDGKMCIVITKGSSSSINFMDRVRQFSTMTTS